MYPQHLSACNPVYEPPTIRILDRLIRETQEHIVKGQILLEDMANTVPTRERAVLWQLELEKLWWLLVASSDVWRAEDGPLRAAYHAVEESRSLCTAHRGWRCGAITQDCAPNVLQTPEDLYAQLVAHF